MQVLKIKVKPNSSKNEILKKDDFYIVKIKAKPEKGQANKEIIKLFTKKFKRKVRIIKGLKNKEKLLCLEA
jgi:uncharacterized protein (TIGR00251 family)